MTSINVLLPKGLVLVRTICGQYNMPEKDYFVIVSSKKTNFSYHLYRLGSGKYEPINEKVCGIRGLNTWKECEYKIQGETFEFSWQDLRSVCEKRIDDFFQLLHVKKFNRIVKQLHEAKTDFVKEELNFLNKNEKGLGGVWMTKPGYAYSIKNRTWPATRIDKLILEKDFQITPEKLIKTTPKLEELL